MVSTLIRKVDINHTTVSKCRTPYLEKQQKQIHQTYHYYNTVTFLVPSEKKEYELLVEGVIVKRSVPTYIPDSSLGGRPWIHLHEFE